MVPKGWCHKVLNELATVERGRFSPRPRNDPKYFGGDIPFVQTGDVTSAKTYLTKFSQTLNAQGVKVSKIFPKNSILITIAANIGETAITAFEVACPDSVVGIQPRKEVNVFWLKMMLETKKEELDSKATQNAQKNINLQVLKPLVFLTPPKFEQDKIAKILSTWDRAIETVERLITNSQQRKKSLMQQLLVAKTRFPGFATKWKEVRLGDLFERVTKRNTELHQNVVTISAQQGLIKQDLFFKKNIASETLDNYFLLGKGQFAYNKSYSNGYPMGAIKRLKLYEKGVVTTLYICFDVKNPALCCPEYFEHYFESGLLNRSLTQIAHEGGRAHGLLNVTPTDFFNLRIIVPQLDEQKKIATILTYADSDIQSLKAQRHHLQQEKKALMQSLLTGKRRITLEREAA